ncbi:MAG: TIR domain-containing protein [Chloroflexota bacterium]|nr:TIR domain-containing protein [Chloroflexota bacterium]
MPQLFISYSRVDEPFARRLATSLSQMGANIWIDIRDIPAGMKWSSAIQQGLDVSEAMIVVISPSSMASQNVEDEWQYYRDRGKPVIPVLHQPAQLHYQLARLQYINFHQQSYDLALSQLHSELWRKGILLNTPPNAVTAQVPRAPTQPPAASAAPQYPPPQATPAYVPPPAAQRKSGGSNWLTLGCVGLVILGLLGGGAAYLSGAFTPGSGDSTRPPLITETPTPNGTITPVITALPQAAQLVVASDSARLRMGPGVVYPTAIAFANRGDVYAILAQAPSLEGTEDWYLIDHPAAGQVWISGVTVDVQPDGVIVPTAATVPPTPTHTLTPVPTFTPVPTLTPNVTPTPLSQFTLPQTTCEVSPTIQCEIMVDNQIYSNILVSIIPYAGAAISLTLSDAANGSIVAASVVNNLEAAITPGSRYTLQLSETGSGAGSVTVFITLLRDG